MDREEFREQITQRYVAGKVMDGASLDEIAEGMTDPVEQMTHLTGHSEPKSNYTISTGDRLLEQFVLIILVVSVLLFAAFRSFQ